MTMHQLEGMTESQRLTAIQKEADDASDVFGSYAVAICEFGNDNLITLELVEYRNEYIHWNIVIRGTILESFKTATVLKGFVEMKDFISSIAHPCRMKVTVTRIAGMITDDPLVKNFTW